VFYLRLHFLVLLVWPCASSIKILNELLHTQKPFDKLGVFDTVNVYTKTSLTTQESSTLKTDTDFLWGILSALNVLHIHDSAVEASNIISAYTSVEELEVVAEKLGSETEQSTLAWIKLYQADTNEV